MSEGQSGVFSFFLLPVFPTFSPLLRLRGRPRPRLGATGKIVSPQKKPPKEQNAINKKKKKMEAQAAAAAAAAAAGATSNQSPEKGGKKAKGIPMPNGAGPANGAGASLPVAPAMERVESMQSQGANSQTDKDDTGMMSPESMGH